MRIIKLSPQDDEFKKLEGVHTFFLEKLRNRALPGQFLLTKRKIGKEGVSPGETLIFAYKGACVYKARASSNRRENRGQDRAKYPYYFLVNVKSIEPVHGNLSEMEEELKLAGVANVNLVTSRSWLTFPDGGRVAEIIDACVSTAREIREAEETVLQILEKKQSKGQGFMLDKKRQLALESYAMDAAKTYFTSLGFVCEDHSKKQPYDLHCKRGKEVLFVEVKGTQTQGEQIILTNGEVRFTDRHKGQMALFILHSILASEVAGELHLGGGQFRLFHPWEVDREWLTPLSFVCRIPKGKA